MQISQNGDLMPEDTDPLEINTTKICRETAVDK